MSPIRREMRDKYPINWRAISRRIRFHRSGGRCECAGECGLHTTTGRCTEIHGRPATWASGIVCLTVAHLDHDPTNCADSNLKAMCQRCHLRYDRDHHAETRARAALPREPGASKETQ